MPAGIEKETHHQGCHIGNSFALSIMAIRELLQLLTQYQGKKEEGMEPGDLTG
jgi:hypothetical protein